MTSNDARIACGRCGSWATQFTKSHIDDRTLICPACVPHQAAWNDDQPNDNWLEQSLHFRISRLKQQIASVEADYEKSSKHQSLLQKYDHAREGRALER